MTVDHNPLTCKKCSPQPWAATEITGHGKSRRFTGWAAIAVMMGPFVLLAFVIGLLAGVSLALAVIR